MRILGWGESGLYRFSGAVLGSAGLLRPTAGHWFSSAKLSPITGFKTMVGSFGLKIGSGRGFTYMGAGRILVVSLGIM